ncbi:MAG: hypothetical protein LHW60_02655 [Candidatus Cloacimonetes bacterium]|nr:hypothetical protein [Candidatus Cloacimonadota bacterium]
MYQQLINLKDALGTHPSLKYVISQSHWETDFLRFYQSQTNYNISKEKHSLHCQLYKDKRSFGFEVDNPDEKKVMHALEDALKIIDKMPADPDFVDVEDDARLAEPRPFTNNIQRIGLKEKTEILQSLAKSVAPHRFELFGTFICNNSRSRFMNSNGLDKDSQGSPIYFEVKAVNKENQVTVLETFGGENFDFFDIEAMRESLLFKIENAKKPVVDVDAGKYELILAPRCVAEFVQYLSYGMNAAALDRHSSYFEGLKDTQVFPEIISITDDPKDPQMVQASYGDGGSLYEELKLIDKGYFRAFTCGKYYHHKTGEPKNGNTAECLKIAPGEHSLEEMIASIKHGLYISSLHYMNFINMRDTSLTGLTRDGTFLIEDGKITKVVNNLRFTEHISEILKNATALENKVYTIPFSSNYNMFDINTSKAPHAKIKEFFISSSTKTI